MADATTLTDPFASTDPNFCGLCTRLDWHVTDSRVAILKAIQSINDYKTADEIVALTQKFHRGTSRATVYRALRQLCEVGVLHKTDVGSGPLRFSRSQPGETPSAEIYIEDCGKILKVPAPFLTWYASAITSRVGLELTGHRLQTFARCSHKKAGGDCSACPREEALEKQNQRKLTSRGVDGPDNGTSPRVALAMSSDTPKSGPRVAKPGRSQHKNSAKRSDQR